jgi:hypothetical protein
MVQDNLQDPSSLTPTGLACIWRALEAHSALPINYTCRLLAQAGLVPRLFAVIRQAVSLQARSERQQQQQQQAGGGGSSGALSARHAHTLSNASGYDSSAASAVGLGGVARSALSTKEVGLGGSLAGEGLRRGADVRGRPRRIWLEGEPHTSEPRPG